MRLRLAACLLMLCATPALADQPQAGPSAGALENVLAQQLHTATDQLAIARAVEVDDQATIADLRAQLAAATTKPAAAAKVLPKAAKR